MIELDEELCIGSGECVLVAPDAFRLGSTDPTVTILPAAATTSLELLADAVMNCPTGALQLIEGESPE